MRVSPALCAFLLLLSRLPPAGLVAQDLSSWIRYSDSGDNPLIVEMIRQGDLSAALDMAAALGMREDPRVGEIILAVGQEGHGRSRWERELILRALLAAVFPASLGDAELEARLRLNRGPLDFLVRGLPDFTLSLRREILRLLGFLHLPEYGGVLMQEGRRLAELLEFQEGRLNGGQAGLALTYLETIRRLGDPEFAETALLILQRSRHLEVADKARSTARSLLSAE